MRTLEQAINAATPSRVSVSMATTFRNFTSARSSSAPAASSTAISTMQASAPPGSSGAASTIRPSRKPHSGTASSPKAKRAANGAIAACRRQSSKSPISHSTSSLAVRAICSPLPIAPPQASSGYRSAAEGPQPGHPRRPALHPLQAAICRVRARRSSGQHLRKLRPARCSFAGAKLNHASFRGSSLANIDFAGAVLDHANLSHASFDELDFQSMASFRALSVTRDQHEAIVTSFGLLTVG